MAKRGHGEEAIQRVLREAESGRRWSRSAGGTGSVSRPFMFGRRSMRGWASASWGTRQLREENGKLKRLVADLSLDRKRPVKP
jgi:hypothetical protein